ncbi:MAG: PAS domain-containing sensor histidine kinase [Candidatus Eisenbacteria bacterium]|uniref:histidine kinase n=1 Tax=Eiseniibacteriota bacterium TaxID=2212470 RepID=A0A538SXM6_UNCEI|nr:MAG: PAS domain-containing sensor histidine kinase [Candidatus Eisenbacteria bacterium]
MAPIRQTLSPALAQTPGLGEALREYFERTPVGMILLREDRRIFAVNSALSNLAGINASILPGSFLRRFLWSDQAGDLEDRIFEEVDRDQRWVGEVDFRSSLGDSCPMMLAIALVSGGEGAEVRYIATVVEMGQQRWIEAESFRRAQELAAFAAIAVATGSSHDPQEMLGAVSRQVVEGLGMDACWIQRFDAAESVLRLVGEASYLNPSIKLSSRMIPDAANPAVLRAMQTRELVAESELLDRSIATVVHMPLLARGEVVGVISILSIAGEKLSSRESDLLRAVSYQIGTAVQNVRLVESVRQHESELQEKNDQLERVVGRLRAADLMKSEFLANTSHELRTPLNSIIGFLNLIIDDLCQDEAEQKELLRHALESSRHLLDLINDVLDLSRIEAGRLEVELENVELEPLLSDVIENLNVQARAKGLALGSTGVSPEVVVHADSARLRQILVNVVGNAIKFTSEGSVSVSVETSPGSPYVEIAVRDTGIGIPLKRREFLFQKFSQADASMTRKFGGSGLGLVIVKELVEMMGGTVAIESPGEGQGTTVRISVARGRSTDP